MVRMEVGVRYRLGQVKGQMCKEIKTQWKFNAKVREGMERKTRISTEVHTQTHFCSYSGTFQMNMLKAKAGVGSAAHFGTTVHLKDF